MSPIEELFDKLAPLFVKYFEDVVNDFKDIANMANKESDPETKIQLQNTAESFIYFNWLELKNFCFEKKIPLSRNHATLFFNSVLGKEEIYSNIWSGILYNDPDYIYFDHMQTDKDRFETIQDAAPEELKDFNRKTEIINRIRTTFLDTLRYGNTQHERLEFTFNRELQILIEALRKAGLRCSPEELKKLIREQIPAIRSADYLLSAIHRFETTLNSIQPLAEAVELEKVVPVIDKEDLDAILAEEWELIDAEEVEEKFKQNLLLIQKLDATRFLPLEFKQPDYSAISGTPNFESKTVQISVWGLLQHFNTFIFESTTKQFEERIREVLEKVKVHIRDKYGYHGFVGLRGICHTLNKICQKARSAPINSYLELAKAKDCTVNEQAIRDKLASRQSAIQSFWASIEEAT